MVIVFAEVLGIGDRKVAVPIFHSIINQQTRITIMTNLLEQSPSHRTFDPWFDETISQFKSLNRLRNKYLHNIWWTHESGKTYLQEDTLNPRIMGNPREIKANELRYAIRRMDTLLARIYEWAAGRD
jgi:hypothetical protein